MNFFKSVFADPDPPRDDAESGDSDGEEKSNRPPDASDPEDTAAAPAGVSEGWGFLIKTLASRSESVIQTYRRDLEEFSLGLKKETEAIREAASRAVKDLPGSLEAGASAAQQSLETVGQAIDDIGGTVWRGTAEIISQSKEALLAIDADSAGANSSDYYDSSGQPNPGSSKRYSRFEVQVLAVQSDPNTFLEEPEDAEDLKAWKAAGFELGDREDEIDELCAENAALESIFAKLVPKSVDYETFWTRYFYKVYKLKQVEDARAELVKRVISREEEEEELSWEVDDDEDEQQEKLEKGKSQVAKAQVTEAPAVQVAQKDAHLEVTNKGEASSTKHDQADSSTSGSKPAELVVEGKSVEKPEAAVTLEEAHPKEKLSDVAEFAQKMNALNITDVNPVGKSDDKLTSEGKTEPAESCKDSDFSVVSSQPSVPEEDDMGWDEIEDLGDGDDKKASSSNTSQNKIDLRKRLSAAEEDEDLSWDIEDD